MSDFLLGEFIKRLRKEKGITQIALCDGLCSVANLSRIEQGKQEVTKYLFDSLLQRLGEDPNKYFTNFLTINEYELNRKKEEIMELIMKEEYIKARDEIINIEDNEYFSKGLGLQFIMFVHAAVCINLNEIYKDIMKYIISAIEITRKGFDFDKITDYVLTRMEINLLNMVAIIYSENGNKDKSVQILSDIVKNAESNYTDDFEKAKINMLIMYSLSKNLGLLGRYNESIDVCDKAVNIGIRNNNMRLLPYIAYNKAWCLYYLGDIKSCKSLLYESYYSARLQNDLKFANRIVEKAQKNFNIQIIME